MSPNGFFKCVQAHGQVVAVRTNEFCGAVNLYGATAFGAESLKFSVFFPKTSSCLSHSLICTFYETLSSG